MKRNFKHFISLIILLAILFGSVNATALKENGHDVNCDEKKLCDAQLDDDFADNSLLVVLNHKLCEEEMLRAFDCYDDIQSAREISTYLSPRSIVELTTKKHDKRNILELVHSIELRDDVIVAEPNYLGTFMTNEPGDIYYGDQYGLSKIQAANAWDIATGSNDVVVGVIDSGLSDHDDLTGNTVTGFDIVNNNAITNDDVVCHGTHVAGIIGAEGNNNDIGVVGVCWNVSLCCLQVDNPSVEGRVLASDVASAVLYAATKNIKILNISIGFKNDSNVLRSALANYNGLVVCAAGNDSENIDTNSTNVQKYPACYDLCNIISVGATDNVDSVASFSNFGPEGVDLFAPGEGILSCYPTSKCLNGTHHYPTHTYNGYHTYGGTSMAAPFVTGVAALIMSIRPDLTTEQIKALILDNVDKIDALSGKCVTGGRLNAYKAVKAATEPQTFTGDVNGDGYADLILSRKVNGKRAFTVFRGKSDGKFNSPVTSTSTKNFSYDDPAFVGDFNGDGKTDILVHWTQGTTGNLLVYTGKSDGTFNEGANQTCALGYYQGLSPYNFFVDDVNGDGKDDLIISTIHYTSGKRRLEIFKGKSTSPYINDVALSEILISTYDYDMSEPEFVGDFNGDGKADYLVLSKYANGGSIYDKTITYLGNSSGPFSEGVSQIVGSGNVSISNNVQYSLADITGDGKTDLVKYYRGSNGNRYSQIFRGKSISSYIESNGGWALSPSNTYDQNFKTFTGDFNGDGLDDLVVHQFNSSKKRQLMLYTGTINNNTISNLNMGVLFTSTNTHNPYQYPSGLYVADVNNDGKDDFIVKWKTSTNKITIYTYLGNGTSFNSALGTTSSIPYFNA